MKINNNTAETNIYTNKGNKKVSYKGDARTLVTQLLNPDSLHSTIALESAVTSGRGYHAYKRGGKAELRERATDDIISAVFWMKGVDMFNKLGNKIGAKIFKLPATEFDVGKDALRTPFENVIENLKNTNHYTTEELSKLKTKLSVFKFSKVVLSSLLAIGFVGFVLPKINQKITQIFMSKKKQEVEPKKTKTVNNLLLEKNTFEEFNQKIMQNFMSDKKQEVEPQKSKTVNDLLLEENTFEEFNQKIMQKTSNNQTSFKGFLNIAAHMLENNKYVKLLTCDVGILSGRVKSARNKDEAREYALRDTMSSLGYYATTPIIIALLQKLTGTKKATSIDPKAARTIYENLTALLENNNGAMSAAEFAKKSLGVLDDNAKKLLEELPFESDVISVNKLKEFIKDSNLITKAKKMALLQPEQAVKGLVLTKQQCADVLKNGSINNPEFMMNIYIGKFDKKLRAENKFIPMKHITKFRDQIDDYVNSIIESAKKTNNGIVDKKLLDKLNKKNFFITTAFLVAGLGISAIYLGIIVPRIQNAMTKKITGSAAAPGLRQYETENNQKTENKN